jgi:putative aldouronate transport system permease protein
MSDQVVRVTNKNALRSKTETSRFRKIISAYGLFYLMAIPGLLYFVVFKYFPLWGISLAFQDYSPFLGLLDSPWVGFKHFARFFSSEDFFLLLRNTLVLSFLNLLIYFPFVIVLSILLFEIRNSLFRRFVQTVVYLPHFLSWVIIVGITIIFFGPTGVINNALDSLVSKPFDFMTSTEWFRSLAVFQSIWKEAGWGTIIFLAALSGINTELYEAAIVDGASRLRRIWHITLPGIKSTIIILLLLRLGNLLDANFMQIFLMSNTLNQEVSDVFDLYVYRQGLIGAQYSFGIAVGLFNSIVGLILIVFANYAAKKAGEDGLF